MQTLRVCDQVQSNCISMSKIAYEQNMTIQTFHILLNLEMFVFYWDLPHCGHKCDPFGGETT
jgi:hypothetical protein